MLKFYYSPRSSATRCSIALEELGLPVEKVHIHLDKGDQKKPEFLAINPNGKVPALVDGDTRVFESVAILIYLGSRYGVEKGLWPKAGTPEEGDALSWTIWGNTEMAIPLFDVIMHGTDIPWAHPKEHRSVYVADKARARWVECAAILDKKLEGRDFILGKNYTLADTALGSVAGMGKMFANLPLDGKNVSAWVQRIQSRPSFGKAMNET